MNKLIFIALLLLFGCRDKSTGCNDTDSRKAEAAVSAKYQHRKADVTCLADDEETYFCEHEPTGTKYRCAGSAGDVKCITWVWELDE